MLVLFSGHSAYLPRKYSLVSSSSSPFLVIINELNIHVFTWLLSVSLHELTEGKGKGKREFV